jgi:hypothetical protein
MSNGCFYVPEPGGGQPMPSEPKMMMLVQLVGGPRDGEQHAAIVHGGRLPDGIALPTASGNAACYQLRGDSVHYDYSETVPLP